MNSIAGPLALSALVVLVAFTIAAFFLQSEMNRRYEVQLISGGQVVQVWKEARGFRGGESAFFYDEDGNLVRLSGTVIAREKHGSEQ